MCITERRLPHVAQPYRSFTGWVYEEITFFRVEFAGSDDFCQFLHVGRFDVHDVERLIRDLHVPQVDAQIVGRKIGFSVRIDRNRVDMIGMRIGKDPPGRSLHHQLHRAQNRDT